MFIPFPDSENLGNSLYKMNDLFHLYNVRYDILMSNKENWNSLANTYGNISGGLEDMRTLVSSTSASWKEASDLVYNVQGFWEEPIFIMYKDTFNMVGNWLEIQSWLNENFDPSTFSPTQVIRCGFTCKNFNADSLEGTKLIEVSQDILEGLASAYGVTFKDIINYINYKNQLDAILSILNSILNRSGNSQYTITDISTVTAINQFIQFNKNTDSFESSTLLNVTPTNYNTLHALLYQLLVLKVKLVPLINKGIEDIPKNVLNKFYSKNLLVVTSGEFFFKIRNGQWSYHPYTNIEFCSENVCGDCYDVININDLYKNKQCLEIVKYVLTECFE